MGRSSGIGLGFVGGGPGSFVGHHHFRLAAGCGKTASQTRPVV